MKRDYTIYIKNETGTETKAKKMASPVQEDSNNVLGDVKKCAAVGFAVASVKKVVSHNINTVSLRTGNVEMQERMSFAYSMVSGAVSLGLSVYAGAKVGGAVGAVVGAAIGLGSTAIDLVQKQDTLNLQRANENISRNLAQIRMGAGYRFNGGIL